MLAGADTVVAEGGHHAGVATENPVSATTRSVAGLAVQYDAIDACGGLGRLRRLRPRRDCGRGRRLKNTRWLLWRKGPETIISS